ncbi:MAG: NAD(P)/FAD-dependent oxidoreductase [Phycisphaerae bacterium]
MPEYPTYADVLIIGAGLAGLACARVLEQHGMSCLILEASDGVGGRVRTDNVNGFLLDRGFHVFLTAYPEGPRFFDYAGLDLKAFTPGALIQTRRGRTRIADPARQPSAAISTALSSAGTLADKRRILKLRNELRGFGLEDLLGRPQKHTADYLADFGFSRGFIDRFFRPFYGGVFLNPDLATSSRVFEYTFRMFADGEAVIPAMGIGTLATQLASTLSAPVLLDRRVAEVDGARVRTIYGEVFEAEHVVVATDGRAAAALLPGFHNYVDERPARSTTCFYYAADASPLGEPTILLDGEGTGPVNNFQVMSDVSAELAPAGAALCSASVVSTPQLPEARLEQAVREQLAGWFGHQVRGWKHLKTYRIPYALPRQEPLDLAPVHKQIKVDDRLYVCGDHRDTASQNGALCAGRRTAEAILAARRGQGTPGAGPVATMA